MTTESGSKFNPLVVFIVLAVIVVTIANRSASLLSATEPDAPAVAPETSLQPFADRTLTTRAGATLAASHVSGGRLILEYRGPDFQEIIVVNLADGKALGRIRLRPEAGQ